MKNNGFLFAALLAMILTSCSSAPTQLPDAIATVAPTSTSTITPTATTIPTATTDPNEPDEYTRLENDIYYRDVPTANGNTLIYSWDKGRHVWERQIYSGYFLDDPKEQNDKGAKDQLLMTVFIDDSIEEEELLPTLTHPENLASNGARNGSTFVQDLLLTAMLDRGMFGFPKPTSFSMAPWYDNSHQFHFDFVNADGPQQWGLWEGSTITVHIRGDFEELKANMDTNGFSETHSMITGSGASGTYRYGPPNSYMIKIWTDADHNLYCDIAPTLRPATKWTKSLIHEMIFFGPASVMESEDLTEPWSGSLLSVFVLNQKSMPYFEFGPPQ